MSVQTFANNLPDPAAIARGGCIGLPVWLHDPSLLKPRQARAAIITGIGAAPNTVNLTAFLDPFLDVRERGKPMVGYFLNVPLRKDYPAVGWPSERFAVVPFELAERTTPAPAAEGIVGVDLGAEPPIFQDQRTQDPGPKDPPPNPPPNPPKDDPKKRTPAQHRQGAFAKFMAHPRMAREVEEMETAGARIVGDVDRVSVIGAGGLELARLTFVLEGEDGKPGFGLALLKGGKALEVHAAGIVDKAHIPGLMGLMRLAGVAGGKAKTAQAAGKAIREALDQLQDTP